MVARCAEGTQGAQRVIKWVARCMESVQRGIEWLPGAWRGHAVAARCVEWT